MSSNNEYVAAPALEAEEVIEEERVFIASQWQLMWWRFRKHKMAMISVVILILLYGVTLFWEFLVPYDPNRYDVGAVFAPPQLPHLIDRTGVHWPPFVYSRQAVQNPVTLRTEFELDPTTHVSMRFLVKGDPYKLWGLFPANLHLFGFDEEQPMVFVLGADKMGRDLFSRLLAGTRISTTIGLAGVFISLVLGILFGGISGYYGGVVDNIIQRTIEFIRAIPTIPLWMALSAAVPKEWPVVRTYLAITLILSIIGWTGLARVIRGRFLSLRNDDFVMAARLSGSSEMRIILRHMVPSFTSHIIASITLAIPGMILSETSLSFLGLGMQPPAISWGVLLQQAQEIRSVALAPWLLLPGVGVVIAVLAFNFLGDGLRDAADPYSR